jgi:hypothetical protein
MRDNPAIIIRNKILGQCPFGGTRPTVPRPEPEEIAMALAEVQRKGISDRERARIAAYAWYSGVDSDNVLELFRRYGTSRILQRELKSRAGLASQMPKWNTGRASRYLTDISLAKELGIPDLGWTVAVLSVAAEADFDAVVECLEPQHDPIRIASYFLVARPFLPPREWRSVIRKLIALDDELSREIVIELLSGWIELTVTQGGVEEVTKLLDELGTSKSQGPVILGALLETAQRFQLGKFPTEIADRAVLIQESIDAVGKKLVIDGKAVKAILKHAGIRDLNVLAAMSRWRQDPQFTQTASRALGRTAKEILDKRFGTRMRLSEDEAARLFGVGGAWSIEPLVQVLAHDGIDIVVFQGYFDTLATDQLSKMTRYRTFLEDRQRAILLLAVTALVAQQRGDQQLLNAVKEAANRLQLQPAGVVEVIQRAGRDELRNKLGLCLPAN